MSQGTKIHPDVARATIDGDDVTHCPHCDGTFFKELKTYLVWSKGNTGGIVEFDDVGARDSELVDDEWDYCAECDEQVVLPDDA